MLYFHALNNEKGKKKTVSAFPRPKKKKWAFFCRCCEFTLAVLAF
jgi:hypothetical protein